MGRRIPTKSNATATNPAVFLCYFITGSIARSANLPVFSLLRDRTLRFFALQGRHVAPMGVKFGSSCQISPPSVQRQGCRTPKIEILLRFDQNVEYKRPVGAYPFRDFQKICAVCTSFQVR